MLQFNNDIPLYVENYVNQDVLDDETDYLQFGQSYERNYTSFSMSPNLLASSYNKFPYEFKFLGTEISINMDIGITERQTYGVLDYLGDLGGLVEILKLSVGYMLYKFSTMRLNGLMLNRLYHVSSMDKDMNDLV